MRHSILIKAAIIGKPKKHMIIISKRLNKKGVRKSYRGLNTVEGKNGGEVEITQETLL